MTRLATVSSIGVPRKMMRSFSSRRVEVERALAAVGLLDDVRDEDSCGSARSLLGAPRALRWCFGRFVLGGVGLGCRSAVRSRLGEGEVDGVARPRRRLPRGRRGTAAPCPGRDPSVVPRSRPAVRDRWRTSSGFSSSRSASRSISSSTSSSVGLDRLLRPRRRAARGRRARPAWSRARSSSTNGSCSWPVTSGTAGWSRPGARAGARGRAGGAPSRRSTSARAPRSSTSSDDGLEHLVAHEHLRLHLGHELEAVARRRRAARRRCRTR